MRRAHQDKKFFIRVGVIVLIIVFLLTIALLLLKKWDEQQGKFPAKIPQDEIVTYEGKDYIQKENIETFLVMGLDKYENATDNDSYNNNQQADFLFLLVFDKQAKKYSALHINRDAMVEMDVLGVAGQKIDSVTKQIALAHTYGNGKETSCRNTADAVSNLLLGMKVNHYISFTMDSVAVMNDLVGGVEVTVLDDFSGIDESLIMGEKVTLRGEQALKYVRTRQGLEDSSNEKRMERQSQYMKALQQNLIGCIEDDEEFITRASVKMADYIVSDRSVTQLKEIANRLSEYEFTDIDNIAGENVMGDEFIEFYPDDDSIMQAVLDLFYKEME